MQIQFLIELLRKGLKGVKFSDIASKLPTLDFKELSGINIEVFVSDIKVISDRQLSVDIKTDDFPLDITYKLSFIQSDYFDKSLININHDTFLSDDVTAYVGKVSTLVETNIIELENGDHALKIPVTSDDIDYDKLYEQLGNYSLAEIVNSIIDTVQDSNTRLRILHNKKEFYDFGYKDEEE